MDFCRKAAFHHLCGAKKTMKMKGIYRFLTIICLTVQSVSAAAQTPQTVQLGIDEMFAIADENNASIKGFRYAESAAAEAVKTARNDRLTSIDF